MSKVVREINTTLSSGESETVEYVPDSGKHVTVLEYYVELPPSSEIVSCISWDGAAIWNLKTSGSMPFRKDFTDADGVKKFELVVDNINTTSPQAVSARLILDVR